MYFFLIIHTVILCLEALYLPLSKGFSSPTSCSFHWVFLIYCLGEEIKSPFQQVSRVSTVSESLFSSREHSVIQLNLISMTIFN